MKMKQFFVLFSLLLLFVTAVKAQDNSVGINTNTPNPNAVLELVSPGNNQGFLVPRVTPTERDNMNLTGTDRGLIVFVTGTVNQFWHWDGNVWKAGLGILGQATITDPNSDLEGSVLAPTIKNGVVGADELENLTSITSGTYGNNPNDTTILEIQVDENGRVIGISEKGVRVRTENIVNGTILNEDIADGTIMISKMDPESQTDQILTINSLGEMAWEDRSAFTSSNLTQDNIYIGDGSDVAQGLPVGGDLTATNDGTQADFQIVTDAVTANEIASGAVESDEIMDETIQSGDILNETILAEDIATGAVTTSEIEDETIVSGDIQNETITVDDIGPDAVGSSELIDNSILVAFEKEVLNMISNMFDPQEAFDHLNKERPCYFCD